MGRKRPTITDLLNDLTFATIFNKYKMLSMSLFEWEGLPETVEAKYIERYLFQEGKAIFFYDNDLGYRVLRCSNNGKVNVNDEPLGYIAQGHGYSKHVKSDDCVIIENNMLRAATSDFIMFYANKLTEAERTIDTNIKRCKIPFIFACDDRDLLSYKRLFQEIDGNVPAAFVDRNLNIDALTLFNTQIKFLGNEIMDYKKSVENEMYTFLGENNTPVDKKERTNVPEVNSNNQLIASYSELQLAARQKACDDINEKYGLNISVRRRTEVGGNVEVDSVQHEQIDD